MAKVYCMTVTGHVGKREIFKSNIGVKQTQYTLTKHRVRFGTEPIFRLASQKSHGVSAWSNDLIREIDWPDNGDGYTGFIIPREDIFIALKMLFLPDFKETKWVKIHNNPHTIINNFTTTEKDIREAAKLEHHFNNEQSLEFRYYSLKHKMFITEKYLDNPTRLLIEGYYHNGYIGQKNKLGDIVQKMESIIDRINKL